MDVDVLLYALTPSFILRMQSNPLNVEDFTRACLFKFYSFLVFKEDIFLNTTVPKQLSFNLNHENIYKNFIRQLNSQILNV